MSVAGPATPEADQSNAEKQERSNQEFLAALDLRNKIRDCALVPPEFDLSKACPCVECASKIAKLERLKEFEIEIKSKKQLVTKHRVQLENNENLCSKLSSAAWWTIIMFGTLDKELKAVSEKLGVALTHENSSSAKRLGDTHQNMQKMLVDFNIVRAPEEKEEPYVADDDWHDDIFDLIDTGRFYYGHTNSKDTANGILDEIEDIEEEKESALAQQDPSISKKLLEKQIDLVEKIPVDELKHELSELILKEIHPRSEKKKRNVEAMEVIYDTSYVLIKKMKELWKESPKGNEHISNGWEQIFDSLINEVNSFEEKWKKDYARFYTPHDRSDPKRQATK